MVASALPLLAMVTVTSWVDLPTTTLPKLTREGAAASMAAPGSRGAPGEPEAVGLAEAPGTVATLVGCFPAAWSPNGMSTPSPVMIAATVETITGRVDQNPFLSATSAITSQAGHRADREIEQLHFPPFEAHSEPPPALDRTDGGAGQAPSRKGCLARSGPGGGCAKEEPEGGEREQPVDQRHAPRPWHLGKVHDGAGTGGLQEHRQGTEHAGHAHVLGGEAAPIFCQGGQESHIAGELGAAGGQRAEIREVRPGGPFEAARGQERLAGRDVAGGKEPGGTAQREHRDGRLPVPRREVGP